MLPINGKLDHSLDVVGVDELERARNFTLVTESIYLCRPYSNVDDDDAQPCQCEPPSPEVIDAHLDGSRSDLRRCNDERCLNAATYIECAPDSCPCAKFCCNQRLQRRQYASVEPFKTENKGYGIRAVSRIPQDGLVLEYIGEIIDEEEFGRRLKLQIGEVDFYYLLLQPGVYIDARRKGNLSRFINHSCEPNCRSEKWHVKNEIRIAILAARDIDVGEEITFDYKWQRVGEKRIRCFCGALSCRGFLGVDKEQSAKFDKHLTRNLEGYWRQPKEHEEGLRIVGQVVRVLWASERSYYEAKVESFNVETGFYALKYPQTPSSENGETLLQQLTNTLWQLFVPKSTSEAADFYTFSIPKKHVNEKSPHRKLGTEECTVQTMELDRQRHSSANNYAQNFKRSPCVDIEGSKFLKAQNISPNAEEVDLRSMFSRYGKIETWVWVEHFEKKLFVGFCSVSAAANARAALNHVLVQTRHLKVSHCSLSDVELAAKHASSGDSLSCDSKNAQCIFPKMDEDASKRMALGAILQWRFKSHLLGQLNDGTREFFPVWSSLKRREAFRIVTQVAKVLKLDKIDCLQALHYLQRFWITAPARKASFPTAATAALLLTLKIRGRKRELKALCSAAYNVAFGSSNISAKTKEQIWAINVADAERELCQGLRYDLSFRDPTLIWGRFIKTRSGEHEKIPGAVAREVKRIVFEAYATEIWLLWNATVILAAAFIIAAVSHCVRTKTYSQTKPIWLVTDTLCGRQEAEVIKACEYMMLDFQRRSSTFIPKPAEDVVVEFIKRWFPCYQQGSVLGSPSASPLASDFDLEPVKLKWRDFYKIRDIGGGCFLADTKIKLRGWPQTVLLEKWATKDYRRHNFGQNAGAVTELAALQTVQSEGFNVLEPLGIVCAPDSRDEPNPQDVLPVNFSASNGYMVFDSPRHDLLGFMLHDPPLRVEHIRLIAYDILRSLDACHRQGIVHRNLYGSKAYVFDDGTVRLGGFQLARFVSKDFRQRLEGCLSGLGDSHKDVDVGDLGKLQGSSGLVIAPPELLLGFREPGPEGDMWQFGCFLAHLILGRPLFKGKTIAEQVDYIFRACGTPNKFNWPEGSKLPLFDIYSQAIKKSYANTVTKRIYEKSRFRDDDIIQFIGQFLCLDPSKRMTAQGALQDPYIHGVTKEDRYSFCHLIKSYPNSFYADMRAKAKGALNFSSDSSSSFAASKFVPDSPHCGATQYGVKLLEDAGQNKLVKRRRVSRWGNAPSTSDSVSLINPK